MSAPLVPAVVTGARVKLATDILRVSGEALTTAMAVGSLPLLEEASTLAFHAYDLASGLLMNDQCFAETYVATSTDGDQVLVSGASEWLDWHRSLDDRARQQLGVLRKAAKRARGQTRAA